MKTAVLLLSCPGLLARQGVVAAISNFIIAHHGGILHSEEHPDTGQGLFFSRLEWDLAEFDLPIAEFETHFRHVADRFRMKYRLVLSDHRPRLAILVSNYDHCLADLLYRHHSRELACEIPAICSNHQTQSGWPTSIRSRFLLLSGKRRPGPSRRYSACCDSMMWT